MIKTVGVLALMATASLAGKPVTINRDVKVTKSLSAESIAATSVNVTGNLMVGKDVSATRVKAALITADVVETGTLSPKAGDTIIIEGDLELSGATADAGTSFPGSTGIYRRRNQTMAHDQSRKFRKRSKRLEC